MTQQMYAMLSRKEAQSMIERQILLENGVIEGQTTYISPADLVVYTKMADGRYKPFADVMREPEHRISNSEITGLYETKVSVRKSSGEVVQIRSLDDLAIATGVPRIRGDVGELVHA